MLRALTGVDASVEAEDHRDVPASGASDPTVYAFAEPGPGPEDQRQMTASPAFSRVRMPMDQKIADGSASVRR